MKNWRSSPIAITLIFGFGQEIGHSAVYYDTAPVNGFVQVALSPFSGNSNEGSFTSTIGTIEETFYYNPAVQSLEAVGSVSVNPASGTFNLGGDPTNPGGSGSASLTVGNSASVSFDMTYQYEGNFFDGYDFYSTLSIPVSGSGVWLGQQFSGSWNLQIPIDLQISASSPSSLSFAEENGNGSGQSSVVISGTDLADGTDDGTYQYRWAVTDQATAVPEPAQSGFVLGVLWIITAALRTCLRRTPAKF